MCRFILFVMFSMAIVDAQISDLIKCGTGLLSNKIFESPVNIDEGSAISLGVNIAFEPDVLEDGEINQKYNEKDGVLHIMRKKNEPATLHMNYLQYEYELNDIHLFWGKYNVTKKTADEASEHSVNGVFFPVEVRMVYKPTQNKTNIFGLYFGAVVKVHFLKVTDGSADSTKLQDIIPAEITSVETADYVAYKGSLTTGAHTKNVLWVVSTNPGSMLSSVLEILRENADMVEQRKRAPIQPLCGRKIYKLTK